MTGQRLYEYYVQAQLNYNCIVDSWDELEAKDKAIWQQIATAIGLR